MLRQTPAPTSTSPRASAAGTPGESAPAACPIPARRQHSPEQRLLFQPGWRRRFLSLLKFQAFYFPPLSFFFLGFKNKTAVFLRSRAAGVALVKTLPQLTRKLLQK